MLDRLDNAGNQQRSVHVKMVRVSGNTHVSFGARSETCLELALPVGDGRHCRGCSLPPPEFSVVFRFLLPITSILADEGGRGSWRALRLGGRARLGDGEGRRFIGGEVRIQSILEGGGSCQVGSDLVLYSRIVALCWVIV